MSRGVPNEFIEEVKQRNDIVSVISKSISLQKKGKNYWACCPFHNEKTPSFAINDVEQFYHCFGCGESGDVIRFVSKYENISYYEALKKLAQDAGLSMPDMVDNTQEIEKLRKKEKVLKALNLAKDYYQLMLSKNSGQARNYLINRGFNQEIVKYFAIGYSPDWNGLVTYLLAHKIDIDTMKSAGLVGDDRNGGVYDFFGTRVMFPILNIFGDCIGFTARTLENNPKFAKYKNSPQTMVFDKSKVVYNIFTLRELRKTQKLDYAIICEGTIDVIAMFKAGFKNTVACMGTAITPFHAREIKRQVDKVLLCLDGDSAGQNAMYKAIDVLRGAGLDVKVVRLPEGLDPDEFLKKYGADKLNKYLDNAMDCIEYKICSLQNKYDMTDNFQKNKYIDDCLAVIRELNTNSERDIYLKILSEKTNVSQDILRRDVLNIGKNVNIQEEVATNVDDESPRLNYMERAMRFILASIVAKQPYANNVLDKDLKFSNSTYQQLFNFLKSCNQQNKTFTISSLFDYFDIEHNADLSQIIGFNFDEIGENKQAYFEQCLKKLESNDLRTRQKQLLQEYKTQRDLNVRRQIAEELNRIAKEIKNGDKND